MLVEEEEGSGPHAPGFLRPERENGREEGSRVEARGGIGGVPAYISRKQSL